MNVARCWGRPGGWSLWAPASLCQEPGPRGCTPGPEGVCLSRKRHSAPLGVSALLWRMSVGAMDGPDGAFAALHKLPHPTRLLRQAPHRAFACAVAAPRPRLPSFPFCLGAAIPEHQRRHLCHHTPDGPCVLSVDMLYAKVVSARCVTARIPATALTVASPVLRQCGAHSSPSVNVQVMCELPGPWLAQPSPPQRPPLLSLQARHPQESGSRPTGAAGSTPTQQAVKT